jgi:glyoxylase-like metal-dependent hydrolase (beta-lactamase superfamily II)
MTIIPLSEGSFTIDHSKVFVPFDKEKDELQQRPSGSLLVEIQPFLVITRRDILLFDTGLGFVEDDGEMQIIKNVRRHGIDPLDITKVLLSHLHRDHAGGIKERDLSGHTGKLSFPNARYYVNSAEWKLASQHPGKSYDPEAYDILQSSGQMVALDESGSIDGYITYLESGAHSPHHTVFWIREEDHVLFFGGDVAPQLQQMKNRFVAKYDFDGKKSMEYRGRWWQQGQEEHWTFLFYHDIKSPSVSL